MFFRALAPLAENGPVYCQKIGLLQRCRYVALCLRYGSQWKTWLGLFPFVALHYVFLGRQSLQSVDVRRCCERPHAGPLLYERRGFFRYEEFRQRGKDFLEKL